MRSLSRSVVKVSVCAGFLSHCCTAFTLSPSARAVPSSSSCRVAAERVRCRYSPMSSSSRSSRLLSDRRRQRLSGGSRVPGFALGRYCHVFRVLYAAAQNPRLSNGMEAVQQVDVLLHSRSRWGVCRNDTLLLYLLPGTYWYVPHTTIPLSRISYLLLCRCTHQSCSLGGKRVGCTRYDMYILCMTALCMYCCLYLSFR